MLESKQSNQRFIYYNERCHAFEQQFNMTSDEFMQKFEAGTIGDDQAYFDWYAAKSGLDIWRKQRDILSGVAV